MAPTRRPGSPRNPRSPVRSPRLRSAQPRRRCRMSPAGAGGRDRKEARTTCPARGLRLPAAPAARRLRTGRPDGAMAAAAAAAEAPEVLKECGCKGIRTCLICERQRGGFPPWQLSPQRTHEFLYCSDTGWAVGAADSDFEGWAFPFPGVMLIEDFVTRDEEAEMVRLMDRDPWKLSQSGRRKQVRRAARGRSRTTSPGLREWAARVAGRGLGLLLRGRFLTGIQTSVAAVGCLPPPPITFHVPAHVPACSPVTPWPGTTASLLRPGPPAYSPPCLGCPPGPVLTVTPPAHSAV
uniref:Uncharacterized protein n=1 Tax=Oryctolagus cuniculus TaxID=9986 RepID=A0A5F9CWC5_RABIT